MSFLSKLIIDGNELTLSKCHFNASQGIDYTGRPSETPKCGQIRLLIEGAARTDFLEWMITPDMTKAGSIIVYRRDNMSKLKKIEFKKTHCIAYNEYFDAINDVPLSIELVLSAESIKLERTELKNKWHVK